MAAPFTSQEQNIKCVKLLALEGRCALSTSFAIFKYMALYSLIQFFSILILYNVSIVWILKMYFIVVYRLVVNLYNRIDIYLCQHENKINSYKIFSSKNVLNTLFCVTTKLFPTLGNESPEHSNRYTYFKTVILSLPSLQFYSILGNNQFLYIDLVLTTLLALSLGRASPGPVLTRQSPPVSLVALSSILPLVIQVSLVLLMQIASIYLLYAQPW